MVFERNGIKILFIHVPKTSGLFTIALLKSLGFKEIVNPNPKMTKEFKLCIGNHVHAEILSQEYDLNEFNYIFSYFRDPIERLKSAYKMLHLNDEKYDNFEQFVEDMFEKYQVDQYIETNFIRPQNEFYVDGCEVFSYSKDNRISFVDKLVKLDYIDVNQSPKQNIIISHSLEKKIKNFYKKDYDLYGYLI